MTPPTDRLAARRHAITSKVRLLGYSHAYDIVKEQIATVQTKHSFNPHTFTRWFRENTDLLIR